MEINIDSCEHMQHLIRHRNTLCLAVSSGLQVFRAQYAPYSQLHLYVEGKEAILPATKLVKAILGTNLSAAREMVGKSLESGTPIVVDLNSLRGFGQDKQWEAIIEFMTTDNLGFSWEF